MSDWNGDPTTLEVGKSVNMPQTTDGSMVLGYQNMSDGNDTGTLNVSSGGGRPTNLKCYAGTGQISTLANNWGGDNLALSNQSTVNSVKIWVTAIGPGYGTKTPVDLPVDGTQVQLDAQGAAQGNATPQWLTLRMQATGQTQTTFALIGGPPSDDGINAYVFGLNMTRNSGPANEGVPPKDGYYQQTTGNTLNFLFNWGSSRLFIANFSGSTAATATVAILKG